jgi:SMI1-KNR4 cell-wall
MSPKEKIEIVLSNKKLLGSLVFVPSSGVSDLELAKAEKHVGTILPLSLKNILKCWNGLHLDIINFFGCGEVEDPIHKIEENQPNNYEIYNKNFFVAFGDDPAAFLYLFDKNEKIYSLNLKSSQIEFLSENLEDFICNLVFGERAREFAGEEWEQELIDAGILGEKPR